MRMAVGLAVVGLLAGCSTASTATNRTVPAVVTGASSVRPYLLAITDVPTGWVASNPTSTGHGMSCGGHPVVPTTINGTKATALFKRRRGVRGLTELLVYTRNPAAAFEEIQARLNGCSSFTDTSKVATGYGTIGSMSLPPAGDQSATWLATIRISGISGAYGFDLVRKGNYVMYLGLGGIGPLDTSTLEAFVDKAVARVP